MIQRQQIYGAAIALALALSGCNMLMPNPPPEPPPNTGTVQPPPPTALPAPEPTDLPTPTAMPAPQPPPPTEQVSGENYPDSPSAVVEAFLREFQAGPNKTRSPEDYLSSGLRAQIRPDNPLNLIMGIQNMYDSFQILGEDGAAGTMRVRFALGYNTPHEWSFALIDEGDVWHIDAITPPRYDGPPPPTAPSPGNSLPTPRPADELGFSGPIAYRDPDGVTIDSVNVDGSDPMQVLGHSGNPIDYLGSSLSHGAVVVGEGRHYYLASGGVRVELGDFIAPPRWSPDGTRIVGQLAGPDGEPGEVYIYNLIAREGTTLPIHGQPDWFPDGQRLVYAASYNAPDVAPGNVYSYDIGGGTNTQLTNLVSTDDDRWYVQEAHVLPGGAQIIFYGNHTSEVGASGNGQKWWWIPVEGGEHSSFSEAGGNGIGAYAANPVGDWGASAERAHWNACASIEHIRISTSSVGGGVAFDVPLPELDEANERFVSIQGITWSADGRYLVFGLQPYSCGADSRELGAPALYILDVREPTPPGTGPTPYQIAVGSYPAWVE
jgi:hypothetical protein